MRRISFMYLTARVLLFIIVIVTGLIASQATRNHFGSDTAHASRNPSESKQAKDKQQFQTEVDNARKGDNLLSNSAHWILGSTNHEDTETQGNTIRTVKEKIAKATKSLRDKMENVKGKIRNVKTKLKEKKESYQAFIAKCKTFVTRYTPVVLAVIRFLNSIPILSRLISAVVDELLFKLYVILIGIKIGLVLVTITVGVMTLFICEKLFGIPVIYFRVR